MHTRLSCSTYLLYTYLFNVLLSRYFTYILLAISISISISVSVSVSIPISIKRERESGGGGGGGGGAGGGAGRGLRKRASEREGEKGSRKELCGLHSHAFSKAMTTYSCIG